jgi:hypothetical protein
MPSFQLNCITTIFTTVNNVASWRVIKYCSCWAYSVFSKETFDARIFPSCVCMCPYIRYVHTLSRTLSSDTYNDKCLDCGIKSSSPNQFTVHVVSETWTILTRYPSYFNIMRRNIYRCLVITCGFLLLVRNHWAELCYNDIGLYGTAHIVSYILWYQFFTVDHNIILLGYNDTTYWIPSMT